MKMAITIVLFLVLLSLVFIVTKFPEITGNLPKPVPNQSLMPEEKVIEENTINIKKQRIESVVEGIERKVGNVVEITSKGKIVRKYPGIIQIVEGNGSSVVSKGRIKVAQE